MTKTLINRNEQRTVISRFRAVAEGTPAEFEHERIRKTKTRAESNTYRLKLGGKVLAQVETGIIGHASWLPNLAALVRSAR